MSRRECSETHFQDISWKTSMWAHSKHKTWYMLETVPNAKDISCQWFARGYSLSTHIRLYCPASFSVMCLHKSVLTGTSKGLKLNVWPQCYEQSPFGPFQVSSPTPSWHPFLKGKKYIGQQEGKLWIRDFFFLFLDVVWSFNSGEKSICLNKEEREGLYAISYF